MKRSVTILGRKSDLLLLVAACVLTGFIVINTMCSCTKCNKSDDKPCTKSCDKKCNGKTPELPIHSAVVGADQHAFDLMSSV
tara:strand:+ start:836 stop:1081 length:246 start_codon:yes stop_codon:yes gene_type:complete